MDRQGTTQKEGDSLELCENEKKNAEAGSSYCGYVVRGRRHEKLGMKCQDYICRVQRDGKKAIALADGAGRTDLGYLGASTAAETAAGILIGEFGSLFLMEKEEVCQKIMVSVQRELYALCGRYNAKLTDVHSTLLAAVCEEKTNRILVIHLGDGFIVKEGKNGKRIVSYPDNGRSRYETYLTSMNSAKDRLRVYRGTIADDDKIFLLSDGWSEFMKTKEDILLFADESLFYEGKSVDDLGVVFLKV